MDSANQQPLARSKAQPGAGSDFLALWLGDVPPGGRTTWLTTRIREAIVSGTLGVGDHLPPTRTLAAEVGVSRGVVTEAYQRLADEGHVVGQGRGGTIVVSRPVQPPGAAPSYRPPSSLPTTVAPGIFDDLSADDVVDRLRAAPARIDLSPGVPDLTAFPRAAWLRAEREVIGARAAAELGYGDPRGAPAFRAAVSRWVARSRGIRVDPDDVLVVAGAAQAFFLLAHVLRDAGTTRVGMEDPGSFGARQQLRRVGLDPVPVAVDDDGLRVDALRSSGTRVVMTTPAHQFPTGVVLSGARRRELGSWVEGGGLVLEDDYDAEHRYDRAPVPALRATLGDAVAYVGSVSKLLAPALRTGWLIAPPRLRAPVLRLKRDVDLGNPALPQLVLAHLMDSGAMERHLRALRGRHRARRDAMVSALASRLPAATVRGAAAGLHLVVTLPPGTDDTAVARHALERGVKVHPLSLHRQVPGEPGLVLGYAAHTPGVVAEGIGLIADVIPGALDKT
ncbi:PLP-dependent aminotransferase family protein [Mumia zhuanghuii]|uniref:PLP-dependent aminotransferase family protein n=2 Tax=Mumia TaxID=1546255 RepID=A0ABW1QMU1_9ACTN|nr:MULTISPECIES: PLP-dependent aminotransferase family protein [Mumia]KAA1419920.1 PLP-dependent aminotransferase family protein [Mumia zhuanghuii]